MGGNGENKKKREGEFEGEFEGEGKGEGKRLLYMYMCRVCFSFCLRIERPAIEGVSLKKVIANFEEN